MPIHTPTAARRREDNDDPLRQWRRRDLLAAGALAAALMPWRALAATPGPALPPTPAQTAGPFYPQTPPADSDADLTRVAGRSDTARGVPVAIAGRILDRSAVPVAGALVEIWQCDAFGRYHHPLDGGGADPGFQGYGRCLSAADGSYQFRTIKPVAYGPRTPHIHFRISARGLPPLITQMYIAGEPGNDRDFVLAAIRDPAARDRVIVPLTAASVADAKLAGTFDIVLAG